MTSPLFKFTDIEGGYDDTKILFGISGSISKGEILGIFGRNGVGKTTLSKVLIGALPITSGSISLDKQDISKTTNFERRHLGIGYMPQTGMVFDNLTVRENLSLAKSGKTITHYMEIFPRLAERQDQLAGSMSGGERKILSFVRTMLEDTQLIVLDEPSEGVAPENIENMQNCIEARRNDGSSFILIEQNMTMLSVVSDHYLGIESGRNVFKGTRKDTTRENLIKVLTV